MDPLPTQTSMRKMLPWLPVLLVLCSGITYGQQSEYDSLISILADTRDSTRVQVLIRLGQIARNTNMETSMDFFHQANREALRIKDWRGVGRALNALGICYGMQGDYARALDEFELARDINLENGLWEGVADAYSSMGIVYRRLGNYPLSLEYYQKSFQIYDSLGSVQGVLALYNNLGVVYDLMKEPDRALEVYNKALQISDSLAQYSGMNYLLNNIALIHLGKEEFPEALALLQRAVELSESQGNIQQTLAPKVNMARILRSMGQLNQAEKLLKETLPIAEEFKNRESVANIHHNLAQIYLKQKNIPAALAAAEYHLQVVEQFGGLRMYSSAYSLLAEIWEEKKDYPKALEFYKLYQQYQDSLFSDEKVRQYKSQQILFDFQESNKTLLKQKAEIQLLEERVKWEKKQRILLLVAMVLLGVTALLIWQKYRARQRVNTVLQAKNKMIQVQKAQIEEINRELEKRMLRAQMNPHFIFNAINSIQHFITENDKVSALKFLNKFSTLLRQVLETSTDVNVLLSEEIRLLEHYIQLESLRFDGAFQYAIRVSDDLAADHYEIPILLVQPFVENAILHGLMNKQGEKFLDIHFEDKGDLICCTVSDNGIGRQAAAAEKARRGRTEISRGLSVTEKRLALLEKNLDYKTMVNFDDLFDSDGKPAGTRVVILIPKVINQ
jgi:tetratricopeptide (TPR) repeat protein